MKPAKGPVPPPARDQAESSFVPILRTLVARMPGATSAALVDADGETVDYASHRMEAFDVKVAAAHLRLAIEEVRAVRSFERVSAIAVRAQKRSFVARVLPDGYALVVTLHRRAGFTASSRAIVACECALAREAGWKRKRGLPAWFVVRVVTDARRRPAEVTRAPHDGTTARAQPVEVLGALVGLSGRERGFRVRAETGVEGNLIREAGGFWYADEEL